MTNEILQKNKGIAKFYFEAQQYFSSIVSMCESVATQVINKGYSVFSWYSGKPLNMDMYNYASNRGACLPKHLRVMFKLNDRPLETFAFFIYFFFEDPAARNQWGPLGCLCKATRKEEGDWQFWQAVPRIADHLRSYLLEPQSEHAYLRYAAECPKTLAGQGIDELDELEIVPFLLASISDSHDLADFIDKSISVLEKGTGSSLLTDKEFKERFLGITE